MWTCPKHSTNFILDCNITNKSKYELEFFYSQVLQDARVKVTESGYIPGQAFPTEQAQLDGDLCYYRPSFLWKIWKLYEFASEKPRLVGHILNKIMVINGFQTHTILLK